MVLNAYFHFICVIERIFKHRLSSCNLLKFDYQDYMRQQSPDSNEISRGPGPRQERRRANKAMITIRIDQDVLDQFKRIAPAGQGYQTLINQALRDWLVARGVKELVREELEAMTQKVISSIDGARSPEIPSPENTV